MRSVTRWRTELGGCNTAAVLGPCRPPLDTAQAIAKAAADYDLTPEGSPEEDAAPTRGSARHRARHPAPEVHRVTGATLRSPAP